MTSKNNGKRTSGKPNSTRNNISTRNLKMQSTETDTNLSAKAIIILVIIGTVLIGIVSALSEIGNAWVDAFNLSSSSAAKVWIFLAIVAIIGGIAASWLGRDDIRKNY